MRGKAGGKKEPLIKNPSLAKEKIDEHKALHQKLMADMSTASIKARRENDPGEFLFFSKSGG